MIMIMIMIMIIDYWAEDSYYEFIYSYRDSINSDFPEFQSETTYNALQMIKKLKEEISSSINMNNLY